MADPGFSQGCAPTPKSAIIFQFFAENCMKMKEFGPRGGVPGAPPPPLGSSNDDIRMQASRFDTDFLSQMKSPTVSSRNSLLWNGMKRTEQICFLQEWTTHSQMLQTCHKSTAQKI